MPPPKVLPPPPPKQAFEWPIGVSLGSAVLWAAMYLTIRRIWKTEEEFSCRIVSSIHALIIVTLASYVSYLGPHAYYSDPGQVNNFHQELLLSVCLGYFLYDVIWCLYYQAQGKAMISHHILSIIALAAVIAWGKSGMEAVAGIICLELTNPFLQARWFLRYGGYKKTWLFKVVDLTFIFMFLFCRGVLGTMYLIKVLSHPEPAANIKIFTLLLYLLSLGFMYHVVGYLYTKYLCKLFGRSPPPEGREHSF